MNYIDIIVLIFVLIGFILGFKDGLVRKLIGFVGFVLGLFLGIILAAPFGRLLHNIFGFEDYFAKIAAGVIIFLVVIVIAALLKRVIHPHDKVNNLINRITGGVMGTLQIVIFLSSIFFLLNTFGFPGPSVREKSLTYNTVARILPELINLIVEHSPDAEKTIKNYIIDPDSL
ncbi:MAG: CvpA family protein [Ignavibacteriaceae bacterium]